MNPILSILTPSIPSRLSKVGALAAEIERQAEIFPGAVEHLVFTDNRHRSIGAKRQALVEIARGQYIAFCDDDDEISEDYVAKLLAGAKTAADVITFKQRAIVNSDESTVHFSTRNPDGAFTPGGITLRNAWHVCAWRRDVVKGCLFGESNYGEDLVWCQQARKRILTEHHIDAVLHTYRHDAATTAAPVPN